ncbi:MAG: T9SS type A sorting domain-containing protein [Bacteroidales bacterium]|nr:T9SS type A sorting domain-containing protein [Bacteroidales bacterium]
MTNLSDSSINASIFDINGKKLRWFDNIENPRKFELDLKDLKQGIFFIIIDAKSNKIIKKFMKN